MDANKETYVRPSFVRMGSFRKLTGFLSAPYVVEWHIARFI
ncbi:keywimysin-related RiPP [Actinoplanes aureus]|nr:keywimysin-related RiPP [Actinoplanes aureus]